MQHLFITLAFILGIGLCACNFSNKTTASESSEQASDLIALRMDVPAFAEKLQNTPNAKLIDVRTPEEFGAGAIAGAVNMDFYASDFDNQLQALDKQQPTFIYCRSGGRSGKTLDKMRNMGFEEVYELKTGYLGWSAAQ